MAGFDFDRVRAALGGEPLRRTPTQALMLVSEATRPRPAKVRAAAGVERVDLDDEIGGWGITASAFGARIRSVTAGTIELHVNSPGGDVWDGLAIYNELLDHPATVNVVVDGLAASAASFIAMAGDSVKMNRASRMMIHDGFSLTVGDENDHLRTAELLGAVSDSIAGIYAARAGGEAAEWRERMRATTWYSATEAVEAGLADEAVSAAKSDGDEDGDEDEQDAPFANLFAAFRAGAAL
jgi:ATP-dependent protease ClpP protease subunit